jgi:hypothetical protein
MGLFTWVVAGNAEGFLGRRSHWKLIREHGGWQLYNLADDIGETKDIAPSEAKRVAELSSLWTRWNAKQSEPLWK